jgi:hypothetical protein
LWIQHSLTGTNEREKYEANEGRPFLSAKSGYNFLLTTSISLASSFYRWFLNQTGNPKIMENISESYVPLPYKAGDLFEQHESSPFIFPQSEHHKSQIFIAHVD